MICLTLDPKSVSMEDPDKPGVLKVPYHRLRETFLTFLMPRGEEVSLVHIKEGTTYGQLDFVRRVMNIQYSIWPEDRRR